MATKKKSSAKRATKAPAPAKLTITIELLPETVHYLEVLGKSDALGGKGTTEDVLVHLAASAAEGVRRPGSWERGWVHQAFGGGWDEHIQPDPTTPWRTLPKRAPKRSKGGV